MVGAHIVLDLVFDGALDVSATFVIHVDTVEDVKDKGGAHVQGAVDDKVIA